MLANINCLTIPTVAKFYLYEIIEREKEGRKPGGDKIWSLTLGTPGTHIWDKGRKRDSMRHTDWQFGWENMAQSVGAGPSPLLC